jgi:hypothetical protein
MIKDSLFQFRCNQTFKDNLKLLTTHYGIKSSSKLIIELVNLAVNDVLKNPSLDSKRILSQLEQMKITAAITQLNQLSSTIDKFRMELEHYKTEINQG